MEGLEYFISKKKSRGKSEEQRGKKEERKKKREDGKKVTMDYKLSILASEKSIEYAQKIKSCTTL